MAGNKYLLETILTLFAPKKQYKLVSARSPI